MTLFNKALFNKNPFLLDPNFSHLTILSNDHVYLGLDLFFFEGEISLIEGQTASTIDIKEKQDTMKQG